MVEHIILPNAGGRDSMLNESIAREKRIYPNLEVIDNPLCNRAAIGISLLSTH